VKEGWGIGEKGIFDEVIGRKMRRAETGFVSNFGYWMLGAPMTRENGNIHKERLIIDVLIGQQSSGIHVIREFHACSSAWCWNRDSLLFKERA
jgi:hypothetical protein